MISRIRYFLTDTLWQVEASGLGWPRRVALRAGRIAFVVLRDLADGQLTLRAMSLVYTTLLSLVPLLAVSFSVLKAFGAHNQIEPFLQNLLLPLGEKGDEITRRIIEFVENTQVGVLGAFGLALLFYTVISLIQKIEHAFNMTWNVRNDRSLVRRFSDYLSVVLIGPVLIFAALGITASLSSNTVVQYLSGIEPLGTLIGLAGRLVPYVLVTAAFTFIYLLVPNTRVRFGAALTGALVAALLWVTLGWGFATFVASSGKYTAIYSAFATLIFFMIWLYLGWMILLVGSAVAFYVQHPEFLGPEKGKPTLSARTREWLALMVFYRLALAFHEGRAPPSARAIAADLRVPSGVVDDVLKALRHAGLVRADGSRPPGWLPARPLERIEESELLDVARRADEDSRLASAMKNAPAPVQDMVDRLQQKRAEGMAGRRVAEWFAGD